jgi:DNA mismatch repair protein MutS
MKFLRFKAQFGSLFLIFISLSAYADGPKSVYKNILEHNLKSLEPVDEEFNSDRYGEYLRWALDRQLDLNEHRKRRTAFLLFDKQKKFDTSHSVLEDAISWQDLTLFCGQKDVRVYFADKVDRTITTLGKAALYGMLAQPIIDKETLQHRQAIIKELIENQELFEKIQKALNDFKRGENILLSCYAEYDPFMSISSRRFFSYGTAKLNDTLNRQPLLLTIRNISDHAQRITFLMTALCASTLLPFYSAAQFINYQLPESVATTAENLAGSSSPLLAFTSLPKNRYALCAIAMAGGIMSMLSVKECYEWMTDNFLLDTFIQVKIMHVARVLESMEDIKHIINTNGPLGTLDDCKALTELFDDAKKNNQQLNQLFTLLKKDTFNTKPSLLTHKGEIFLAYKLFADNKKQFEKAMLAIGELDAYLSLATLYKEHLSKKVHYCFAQYADEGSPVIHLKDFWNPFIDAEKVVPNSLEIGTGFNKNMIVTGPNAGGKSTLLKAIALTIIMAQTFGIAPASEMRFTPFNKIITYLNITDDIGAGNSLFKAQAQRAQYLMDTISKLNNNELSFTIIDEMFNGTSPKEAQACAFSLAKSLGNIPRNIAIVATHFDMLTQLEALTGNYANYHVSVERLRSGDIIYPFKLERGISDQHVALDILKAQGFQGSIVQDAQDILLKSSQIT